MEGLYVESVRQVRWDYDLTQESSRPMYVENGTVDRRDYIKDIRSDVSGPDDDVDTARQQKLPEHGIIAWWFGQLGDRIKIYND
jgi:hypothetical protein